MRMASHRAHRLTRRSFLHAGAAGLAGAPLAGCAPASEPAGSGRRPELSRPDGVDDVAWTDVRDHFILEPGTAYMNNASLGMPPASVAESVAVGYEALSREPLRGKNDLGRVIADRVVPGLAALLGAEPDEIALTRNATEALHMGAVGVRLRPGDEVLVTSQEHPAGRRPWEFRAQRDGVKVNTVFIPSPFESGEQVVGLVEEALTPATRVLAFCHVTRGGHLYPVADLCALARERGIVSHVDGAQAVGMFPVDLHALACDTYSASLHKWLLGPMGTGVFYVRRGVRDRVHSAFAHDATVDAPAYQPPGTIGLPVRAGLAATLDFFETLGLEHVAARTRHLSDHLKQRLRETRGVTLLSGPDRATSCPGSTIFELEGLDAVEAVSLIAERARIHIDEHQRDGHNAIRISTHVYNTTAEIDRLVDAFRGLSV
ncbi:MAG: aminotransferase class V-fold PLP-dependent enzyme [Gemmatimonadetes bacterium]|nr:aminotransferase class V-fold PLP-dependent enzyme [Gemmatimonadota bacterium]MYG22182.1 aminotransferase class V-fold PLP-dependent enzyme [Gemmatimonadota bacterium]MYJ37277.1 aminotransferase class V-fold PLP-dependent enzyme [Gemmatimonadota bacterium]